ncbi:MAG: hypothetical protein WD028_13000 [Balneolaceae bacterium]
MNQFLGPVKTTHKTGDEPFHQNGEGFDFDLRSFWQWSASDLLSNATRGILAEFLVAHALGDTKKPRVEWDPFDVITKNGIRVEVKSSAYLQSWNQDKLSRITFSTRPTFAWESNTNSLAEERKRQADVYVFCLLNHKRQETVDPLNIDQWKFYVISTKSLNVKLGEQKSLGLNTLMKIGAKEAEFENLESVVEKTADNPVA